MVTDSVVPETVDVGVAVVIREERAGVVLRPDPSRHLRMGLDHPQDAVLNLCAVFNTLV